MTGREVASLFGAKRVSKGRWLALCTAHPDRKPSLSISEGRKAVLLRCQSQQCAVRDICQSAGITVQSLWYQQSADPHEIRRAQQQRREEEASDELVRDCRSMLNYQRGMWIKVATALAWLLFRHPNDKALSDAYEYALCWSGGELTTWTFQEAPYSPFPAQKLLHNIKPSHTTPEIARVLKLRG
jgi:hypothetical protein